MEKYKKLALLVLISGLSACASFSGDPHPGKTELVGVLLAERCTSAACDFSLLDEDLETPLARLKGNIDRSLEGRLIAVLGEGLSPENGVTSLMVERNHSITEFDYRSFLEQAVPAYTESAFGCVSLWDQSYAWRVDGRQPVLISTLINPFDTDAGRVSLEFDGLTRALMKATRSPDNADPCKLR